MKNKSLFNKISLLISIVILFLILILSVLGSFNRVGYLSEFKLISSKKNIYTYNFRIKYHSKVFRNSDIYGVYINSKNIINANKYIRKITMNEIGSPFGILESNRKINGDIDNIVYTLKLKKSIIILSLVLVMILLLNSIIIDFIKKLSKFNFRNRYAYILIIFLCFLIMPSIIYKIFYDKFDHTNYENRNKAKKPVFAINNLYKYPREYEKYFNDYIPFRTELVQLKNLMDIFLFNNISFKNSLKIGKDKWLFNNFGNGYTIKSYIGIDKLYLSTNQLEIAKNNLLYFRDELKKKNIRFILMVCPSKQFIYDEYMPNYIIRKTDVNPFEYFIRYINDNTDIDIVYPKDELIKYKHKYQLYYKYDTHWNKVGAYIGYTQIMSRLSLKYNRIEDVNLYKYNSLYKYYIYNNIATTLGLGNHKYYNDDFVYFISNYTTNIYREKGSYTNHLNYGQTYSINNINTNKIMIIGDSFSYDMFDYIASSFKESTFVNISKFKSEMIIDKNPNIIVLESLDRLLIPDRLFNVLPNYKIEEINKDLKTNSIIKNN